MIEKKRRRRRVIATKMYKHGFWGILGLLLIISTIFLEPYYFSSIEQTTTFRLRDQMVTNFAYLLQYPDYKSKNDAVIGMADAKFDLLVMDPYFTESESFTTDGITEIRSSDHPKLVLAYLSIGEAENYRTYWNDTWDVNPDNKSATTTPEWLDPENPNWPGNYKVKYWMPGWQQIILGTENSSLDQILALGFDGVYLDIIDGYQYYEDQGVSDAADLMVQFVGNISKYAKNFSSEFLIVPQNAEELVLFEDYLNNIDGIGREEILYYHQIRRTAQQIEETRNYLQTILEADKFVLQIEYVVVPRFQRKCIEFANDFHILCYLAPRQLHYLKYPWRISY